MKREHTIWLLIFVLAAGYIGWRVTTKGAGCVYQPVGDGVLEPAWEQEAGTARLDVARTAGVWVAAGLTLCILSFAYRDNPFYKIAESILVGVSAAYWMVVGFWTTIVPNLLGKLFPGWINSVAARQG